jgi:hypothetical protein
MDVTCIAVANPISASAKATADLDEALREGGTVAEHALRRRRRPLDARVAPDDGRRAQPR